MPLSPPKPCTACGVLVRDGTARCEAHKVRDGQFADSRRGSRQSRGYGAGWEQKRRLVLQRADGMCECDDCKAQGRLRSATQVDHKINKARWRLVHGSLTGVDADSNLQAINADCHKVKTAREAQQGRGGVKV